MFVTLVLFAFLAFVAVAIFMKLRPQDSSVLKTLASNRLRIEFAQPPPAKNTGEEHYRKLTKILDDEGYSASVEVALQELDKIFVERREVIYQFIETTDALILLAKFVGVNGFQLSNRLRTPTHYKNLHAATTCLRTITEQPEGMKALISVFNALYDIYISVSYGYVPTRTVALSILAEAVAFSEEGYDNVLKSAVDYMYIPGDEEYLFAHLIQPLLTTPNPSSVEDVDYYTSVLNFLKALLTSNPASSQAMVRKHLNSIDLASKLQAVRENAELASSVDSVLEALKGEEQEPNFHTTPFERKVCYCHQFASRVRWFSRIMNCLFATLPGTLPIGEGAMQLYSDEFRKQSEEKMNELKAKKRSGNYTSSEIQKFNREMSALTLGVGSDFFDHMKECGMFAETKVFIEQSEKVENWNHEELLQAGRNVWTCFGLQMILYQQNVVMSDAYLGYSLLYPYTDNYLDDDTITPKDKKTFQDLFTRRLAGEDVKARSDAEQKIWDCVTMVERRFDRKVYPNAFNSMIAINEAQTKSLLQHTKTIPPNELIMEISMEKGGTSVLADGYLVEGDMTEEDALFAFGLGVALQLVDDLQDTSRDIAVYQHTMFTLPFMNKLPCDTTACRLIWLMQIMVNPANYKNLDDKGNHLRFAMLKMTNTIAMKAIAKYCYIFTEEFVERVANCAPIHLSNLSRVNNMARMLQMVRSEQI